MLASKDWAKGMETHHTNRAPHASYHRGVRSLSPALIALKFPPEINLDEFNLVVSRVGSDARAKVDHFCAQLNRQLGIVVDETKLKLVVDELLNNVAYHGILGLRNGEVNTFLTDRSSIAGELKARLDSQQMKQGYFGKLKLEFSQGEVVISVTDSGPGPAPTTEAFHDRWSASRAHPGVATDEAHGRGLKLVAMYLPEATKVDYTPPSVDGDMRIPYWLVLRFDPTQKSSDGVS